MYEMSEPQKNKLPLYDEEIEKFQEFTLKEIEKIKNNLKLLEHVEKFCHLNNELCNNLFELKKSDDLEYHRLTKEYKRNIKEYKKCKKMMGKYFETKLIIIYQESIRKIFENILNEENNFRIK